MTADDPILSGPPKCPMCGKSLAGVQVHTCSPQVCPVNDDGKCARCGEPNSKKKAHFCTARSAPTRPEGLDFRKARAMADDGIECAELDRQHRAALDALRAEVRAEVKELVEAVREWQEAGVALRQHLVTRPDSGGDTDLREWNRGHDERMAQLHAAALRLATLDLTPWEAK